jgi:large subunit ribosomal protein L20
MRVKTGFTRKRRHKKVLKATKGFRGARSKLYKSANEAYIKMGEHAFKGRRERKRDMRRLWILRINAGLKEADASVNYSQFINKLNSSKIELNRKMLSELAVNDPKTFKEVVTKVTK